MQMDGSKNALPDDVENVRTSNHHNQTIEHKKSSITQSLENQGHNRNLTCFWLIGICNAIGGVLLSSGTFDILKRLEGPTLV